ncbi:transglycosylase SLT domain-containing protein [Thiolinea disciformis]|uniref:transglycosylase SLT domain-containing protein n=1 Tax=Thiolinea disciformis TaxID=125614 RepID=UPI000370D45A|nr:transglycosylase SLT domain-containing protein [Thiolinea disciformis]
MLKINSLNVKAWLLALLALPLLSGFNTNNLESQRQQYRAAQAQIEAGQLDAARQTMMDLRTYPLYPWLEYSILLRNFRETPDSSLKAFVERYPNSLMSDGIYARWANRLSDFRDWHMLLKYIPEDIDNTAIQCYRAEAMISTQALESGIAKGKQIWQGAKRGLPNDCGGLLVQLIANNILNDEILWARVGEWIDNNRLSEARDLAKYITTPDAASLVDQWIETRRNPSKLIPELLKKSESPQIRAMIVSGIKQAADKKLQTALDLWASAQKTFKFTPEESGEVESKLGMWEAWRHDDAGLKRLKALKAEHRSPEGNIGMARLALRLGDWDAVLSAVEGLEKEDDDEGEKEVWRYWKARALEQKNQASSAKPIYKELSQDATYYGFLAADRLGEHYELLKQAPPDRSQRMRGINKLAVIQRWQEWMALGERSQARREWFRLLQAMDKVGVQALAETALRNNDPNLAIWTLSRTKDWNSIDIRFPLLYQNLIMEQSRTHGIQPAWILGVMRRESAFDEKAQSGVNALGLMQLMPGTAREVAKRLGMQVIDKEAILEPTNNIQLGSAYLRRLLQQFDGNYAQATAAYNAGPGRIPQWRPDQTLEADRWVESIPFKETRQYVRAVMAYTTVYDYKLNPNEAQSLSERLQPIKPK